MPMSNGFRIALVTGVVTLSLIAWVGARSGVEVELTNGQVLRAEEAERDGDNYVIRMEDGSTVVVPTAAVRTVRLSGVGSRPRRSRSPNARRTA